MNEYAYNQFLVLWADVVTTWTSKTLTNYQARLRLFAGQTIYGGSGLERCSGLSRMLSTWLLNFAIYHPGTLRFDVFNHSALWGVICAGFNLHHVSASIVFGSN